MCIRDRPLTAEPMTGNTPSSVCAPTQRKPGAHAKLNSCPPQGANPPSKGGTARRQHTFYNDEWDKWI
eukprot:5218422-Heterocapsa_arctica.AAC.1